MTRFDGTSEVSPRRGKRANRFLRFLDTLSDAVRTFLDAVKHVFGP